MPELSTPRAYADVLQRLNRASVQKHYGAYEDIAWDAPEHHIDPDDPRWEIPPHDPLGATEWYRSQPLETRTRMGLELVALRFKLGSDFENVLSRGLLEFAEQCPNGSAAWRYAYHELIEEAHHSQMFQEFVNRSEVDPAGMSRMKWRISRMITPLGRQFPELFFVVVLTGEVPTDTLQRIELRSNEKMHPLSRRIMQIHVTEEARHVCFARNYMCERIPQLSGSARAVLRVMAPVLTNEVLQSQLPIPAWFFQRHRVPSEVVREARRGPLARRWLAERVQPLLDVYSDIGLITSATAPLWHALGYPSARSVSSGVPNAYTL